MNLLLLAASEITENDVAVVTGRQANHAIEILKIKVGSSVKVGVLNGMKGTGIVQEVVESKKHSDCKIVLKVNLTEESKPASAPLIDLLVALPRPKTFEKVLSYAASMGVGRIFVTCTERVEKAYFSSPLLTEENIRFNLQLGLEQCVDTLCPDVVLYPSWYKCCETIKSRIAEQGDYKLIVAHPSRPGHPSVSIGETGLTSHNGPVLVAVGPEGGFYDSEVEQLEAMGFQAAHLGSRILKVEAALIMVHSQINMLLTDPTIRQGNPIATRSVESLRLNVGRSNVELPRRPRDVMREKKANEAAEAAALAVELGTENAQE